MKSGVGRNSGGSSPPSSSSHSCTSSSDTALAASSSSAGTRPILCPVWVLPGEAVTCLRLVGPRGEPVGAPNHRTVRPLDFRHPVSPPGGSASHPCRASVHFFPEISRLRCTRGLGSGIARAFTRSEYSSHSTPRASGSSAARLAHSSAFSLPRTSLVCRAPLDLGGDVRRASSLASHQLIRSHASK